jgi:hypothetical protein
MEIDRDLYVNGALNRATNHTLAVPRMFGKIALEEAVGSSLWTASGTLPVTQQINGFSGLPFTYVRSHHL